MFAIISRIAEKAHIAGMHLLIETHSYYWQLLDDEASEFKYVGMNRPGLTGQLSFL
jgi:hypothetical protein